MSLEVGHVPPPDMTNVAKVAQPDDLNISTIIAAFSEHRRWAYAIVGTFMFLASAFAYILPNTYEAHVVLAPAPNMSTQASSMGSLDSLAALAGISTATGVDPKQEAIAVLKSRSLTEQFITERDLLPVLFARDWDAGAKRWSTQDPEDIPTLDDAFEMWDEKVRSVEEDSFTGLVTLTVAWRDRQAAARWAVELIDLANSKLRERAIADAKKGVEYLEAELAKTTAVEVRQSIYGLIEAQVNKSMLAEVQTEYAFRVIDPPTVPDADHFVRPKRALIVFLGFTFGMLISAFVVVNLRPRGTWRSAKTS